MILKVLVRVWCGCLALSLMDCSSSSRSTPLSTVLKRPSKSSAVAITGDDRYVVQVNPENDSITVIRTAADEKIAELAVGDEPSSVVIGPDDSTAYVALRAEAKVVKIQNVNTSSPSVAGTVDVGSEPTGVALSPRGDLLVVAEFAEGRVSLIDTATMQITKSAEVRNPRAVAISNNGDQSDADEKVVVPEFYGRSGPGPEGSDNGRTGAVNILNLTDLAPVATVTFAPVSPGAFVPTSTAPNQLGSVGIAGDRFFVTAVGASPDGAPRFNENVFPIVLIGNLASGSAVGAVSLADAIRAQVASPRNFMADLIDFATVGNDLLYLLGRGADAIQRVVFVGDTAVTLGTATPAVSQIDLLGNEIGCQNPIGVVTPHDTSVTQKMYVNCWVSRTATVVDLQQQKAVARIATSAAPAGGDAAANRGRRFYFTGRGRWSNEAWSSCGSCHPDGLSDNVTWHFAAGPRQSTSMDGTFSHGSGAQKQRILNWSGIFDELHDFERNTRDVSGGLGALTIARVGPPAGACGGDLSGEQQIDISTIGGLAKPLKEVQDENLVCGKDWDDINEFVKTIRPPRAKRFADAAAVARGRALFEQANQGNCASCHGGAGWTLSRLFYTPSAANNTALANLAFTSTGHTIMIEAEQTAPPGATNFPPPQVACVLRPVGSFGVPGDATATSALELKAGNPPAARAQGEFAGYNAPSLYGLGLGAPYFHHGQAATLDDVLNDSRWNVHLVAGNPVFNPSTVQRADLKAFLLSIDATTTEAALPSGADTCPATFP